MYKGATPATDTESLTCKVKAKAKCQEATVLWACVCVSGVPGKCSAASSDGAPDALPSATVPPGYTKDRERGGEPYL